MHASLTRAPLIAVGLFLAVATIVAADEPQNRRQAPQQLESQRCWKDREEIENPDVHGRPSIPMPEELLAERLLSPSLQLKVCIDSSGKVVRTLRLKSSGNDKVDDYYRTEWSKRTFKPVMRNGAPIESVVTVAILWNLK